MVSVTTVATLHISHLNRGFLGRLRTTYHRQCNKRLANDCGAVSMPKDSIQTRVVTVDTAIHFIIPIETLSVCFKKNLPFLFIKQHKLWNDAQLRIATVTRFSWYVAANATVFCGLIKNISGFDLPRQQWSLLNRFRTEQGHCGACRRK